MSRLEALAKNPLARAAVAMIGFGAIVILIRHSGPSAVWAALTRAAILFPAVAALEGLYVACDMCALRMLYGPDRHRLPTIEVVRAGLLGYPVTCLVPFGRAVAEAARAAMLARYAGALRASVAAARLQGVILLANAAISIPCALAALWVLGPSLLPLAIGANIVATLGGGLAVFYAGRHARVGAWLAKRTPRAETFGPAFDAMLRAEPAVPWGALAFGTAGRAVQVVQYMILVVAVGGHFGVVDGLLAQGVHLVGAAIGDLVPAGIGATEANFTLAARALSLSAGDSVSIAILAHMAAAFWLTVGLIATVFWPAGEARESGQVLTF